MRLCFVFSCVLLVFEWQFDVENIYLITSFNFAKFLDVSDYGLEEEARDYVQSIHIEDDPVGEYNIQEYQQHQEYEDDAEEEEIPVDEMPVSYQGAVSAVQDSPAAAPEEPAEETPKTKKSYAAIVRT